MNKAELVYHVKHTKGVLGSKLVDSSPRDIGTGHVRSGDLAIIIHMFYPDQWEKYNRYIERITVPHHIFITTPHSKVSEVREAIGGRVDCTVIPFPNRGRDILPFLHAVQIVDALGYSSLLKLHTKKSMHRTDGKEWAESMLTSLLPNEKLVSEVLLLLKRPNTGLVGPVGEYLSLDVNFAANGMHMTHIINRLYGKDVSYKVLHKNRNEYGFFAGSMFWAPVRLFSPLCRKFAADAYFEKEKGQVDATFAHAIERVISIVAEIEGKQMFQILPTGIAEIPYDAGITPDWSNVAT